jgi:hypothetical protein
MRDIMKRPENGDAELVRDDDHTRAAQLFADEAGVSRDGHLVDLQPTSQHGRAGALRGHGRQAAWRDVPSGAVRRYLRGQAQGGVPRRAPARARAKGATRIPGLRLQPSGTALGTACRRRPLRALRGSRQLAEETITRLVHPNGVFPHDAGAAVDIALIGANVDDAFVLFGFYSFANHILT